MNTSLNQDQRPLWDRIYEKKSINFDEMVEAWRIRLLTPFTAPIWQSAHPLSEVPGIIQAFLDPSQMQDVWRAKNQALRQIQEEREKQERLDNLEESDFVPELKTLKKP